MSNLSVVILCGQSPRHLYFANKLCQHCNPKAIIQESNHNLSINKIVALLLNPKKLWQKIWRWLRDRKRYAGNPEAKFFFGDSTPVLNRQDL
ncbi:MAG: formyl transferase, partial [Methyloprofundus sp.]|nr:formyl transferase [Methyloprofundus sp.]